MPLLQAAIAANLRSVIEQRFPTAVPAPPRLRSVETGIPSLDALLPGNGFPRGHLTVWAPGAGATAILRGSCRSVLTRGERTAWIDGSHELYGNLWKGVVVIRPTEQKTALAAAEELLSSEGFSLLVLSGVQVDETQRLRLTKAAREGGSAFIVRESNPAQASLRISSRIVPASYTWRRNAFSEPCEAESVTVEVTVSRSGLTRTTKLLLPIARYDVRLSLEPGLVDRRGAGH